MHSRELETKEIREEEHCSKTTLSKRVHQFVLLFKSFPLISYCYTASFCIHLTMRAVLSTLTFPSSPFPPRNHFQYYRLLSDAGILIGGMGHLFISCLCNDFIGYVRVRKIWILVLLEASHLLLLFFASWYRFLPSVVPVLIMCLTQGVIHGMTLVQCVVNAANLFTSERDKGTAFGWIEVALSVGRIAAGFLGVFTEKYLREHCTFRLLLGRYCLARHSSFTGWETNSSCSI